MIRPFAVATFTFAILGLGAIGARADEAWQGPSTHANWVDTIDGFAVFAFTVDDPKIHRSGTIFVDGLDGNDQNRGTFGGYWSTQDPDAPRCPMPIVDANGNESWTWGAVELTFKAPAFPAGWTASLGLCFDDAQTFMDVDPMTGG